MQQWTWEQVLGIEPAAEGKKPEPRTNQADKWATRLAAATQFFKREGTSKCRARTARDGEARNCMPYSQKAATQTITPNPVTTPQQNTQRSPRHAQSPARPRRDPRPRPGLGLSICRKSGLGSGTV
ncbi:hypothetical protein ACFRDV_39315 [Streptomyces fagopyri]|uniref:hypothetical protein n=1 Tax=Streptomyces fagopyri TaxID=2662397 RepID=UPI0036CF2C58